MSFVSNPELRERGQKVLEELYEGGLGGKMNAEYRAKSSDFANMTLEWMMGGILARPGLDMKSREFVAFALCVADGRIPDAVQAHAEALLRVGATKEEIYETILMCLWYTGAAPVSMALSKLKPFFEEPSESEKKG